MSGPASGSPPRPPPKPAMKTGMYPWRTPFSWQKLARAVKKSSPWSKATAKLRPRVHSLLRMCGSMHGVVGAAWLVAGIGMSASLGFPQRLVEVRRCPQQANGEIVQLVRPRHEHPPHTGCTRQASTRLAAVQPKESGRRCGRSQRRRSPDFGPDAEETLAAQIGRHIGHDPTVVAGGMQPGRDRRSAEESTRRHRQCDVLTDLLER